MAATDSLGIGVGYIYYTNKDKGDIVSIFNDGPGAIEAKKLASASASTILNREGVGEVEVTAVGTGSVDDILVNGESQIGDSYTYTSKSVTQVATDLSALINEYTAKTTNYSSVSGAGKLYLLAPKGSGSDVNGHVVDIVDNGGNLTTTIEDIDYGSNNTELYADAYGYRFFINADFNSAGIAGEGVALINDLTDSVEITKDIIPRMLQSATAEQAVGIESGAIKIERVSSVTCVSVDTENCSIADTLSTIRPTGFADYDTIIIRGEGATKIVTVDESGNIVLGASTTFLSGGKENTLTLSHIFGIFYEVTRSTAKIGTVSAYRTASIPFAVEGVNAVTMTTGTTVTIEPGTDEKYTVLSGTPTLAAHYSLVFGTSAPVAGDMFFVKYTAKPVTTTGTYNVTIGGVTLTDDQATTGAQFIIGYYGSSWNTVVIPEFNSEGNTYQLETAFIAAEAITVAKVESDLTKEVLVIPVSFETSELGAMKVEMNYPGTVNEIHVAVDKLIEATNDATITPTDNAAATMTAGTVTLAGGSEIGKTYITTPTGNNTFVAGDILTFTTAKTTAGGKAIISLLVTKS